jgi:hypothetical protein
MTEKMKKSIKQRVGKAVARYRREKYPDVAYGISFSDDRIDIMTIAAKGDNVHWAREPMAYIYCALLPIADPIPSTRSHCRGNFSETFKLKKV